MGEARHKSNTVKTYGDKQNQEAKENKRKEKRERKKEEEIHN